jgi:hypothetical protein
MFSYFTHRRSPTHTYPSFPSCPFSSFPQFVSTNDEAWFRFVLWCWCLRKTTGNGTEELQYRQDTFDSMLVLVKGERDTPEKREAINTRCRAYIRARQIVEEGIRRQEEGGLGGGFSVEDDDADEVDDNASAICSPPRKKRRVSKKGKGRSRRSRQGLGGEREDNSGGGSPEKRAAVAEAVSHLDFMHEPVEGVDKQGLSDEVDAAYADTEALERGRDNGDDEEDEDEDE